MEIHHYSQDTIFMFDTSLSVIPKVWNCLYKGNDTQNTTEHRYLIDPWEIWIKFSSYFMLIMIIDGGGISYEIALRWLPLNFNDDKSTLVQVMAWCRQATSHHLNQCWPRSLPPYGVTRQHWVKTCINKRLSMLLISSAPMPPYLEYTHLLKCKVIPIFGVEKFDFADAESAVGWRHRNVNYIKLEEFESHRYWFMFYKQIKQCLKFDELLQPHSMLKLK